MIVHLDGQLIPRDAAHISPFDRGFLFGDGVYEGLRAESGRVIGMDVHIERLEYGLAQMRIEGFNAEALSKLTHKLLSANELEHAFIYWQITRGAPGPDDVARHRTPARFTPTVFGFAEPVDSIESLSVPALRTACILPDTRWTRGRIKSISLAGGVLAAIEAHESGDEDAILVRDGRVTEATSSNVFVVKEGVVATPDLAHGDILEGVTRRLLLEEMPEIQVRDVAERELHDADEIALCGTTTMITGVSRLAGAPIGAGETPGPVTCDLFEALRRAIRRDLAEAAVD